MLWTLEIYQNITELFCASKSTEYFDVSHRKVKGISTLRCFYVFVNVLKAMPICCQTIISPSFMQCTVTNVSPTSLVTVQVWWEHNILTLHTVEQQWIWVFISKSRFCTVVYATALLGLLILPAVCLHGSTVCLGEVGPKEKISVFIQLDPYSAESLSKVSSSGWVSAYPAF